MKKQKKYCNGQVLLESMVAIGIMATTLLTIVSLALVTLRISRSNSRRTIASNLAKETLEVIRAERDNSGFFMLTPMIEQKYFRMNYDLNPSLLTTPRAWYFEEQTTSPQNQTPTSDIYRINYNAAKNVWLSTDTIPVPTPSSLGYFYRQIIVQDYENNSEKKKVDVKISFFDRGKNKIINYTTIFSNWK